MKIYLLRHTETIEGNNGIILGKLGGNLSEKGKIQAKVIGRFLQQYDFGIEKIYTSSSERALQTTNIINTFLQKSIISTDILKERSAGEAEGKKESEIDWESYEKTEKKYRKHKGGESFIDVQNRAKIFLENLQGEVGNILVISHSVMVCMIFSLVKNISIEKALKTVLSDKIICLDTNQKTMENIIIEEL